MKPQPTERDVAIVRARLAGGAWKAIAETFHISRGRTRLIFSRTFSRLRGDGREGDTIDTSYLSFRARNCLTKGAGFDRSATKSEVLTRLGELRAGVRPDGIYNFGAKTLAEVERWLAVPSVPLPKKQKLRCERCPACGQRIPGTRRPIP